MENNPELRAKSLLISKIFERVKLFEKVKEDKEKLNILIRQVQTLIKQYEEMFGEDETMNKIKKKLEKLREVNEKR